MSVLLIKFKLFFALSLSVSFNSIERFVFDESHSKYEEIELNKNKYVVAKIVEDKPELMFDKKLLSSKLISNKIFADVESVDVNYEIDDNGNLHSYLSIIGKDLEDFSLKAFVAELSIKNNKLFISDKKSIQESYYLHTCKNDVAIYKSCAFEKDQFMKIIGCAKSEKGSVKTINCNHSISTGSFTISKIVKLIAESI